jgi:hypothetical protein
MCKFFLFWFAFGNNRPLILTWCEMWELRSEGLQQDAHIAMWSLVESYDYWICGGKCGQWQKHHHCLDKCGNHVWSQAVSYLYRSWMCVPVQGYLKRPQRFMNTSSKVIEFQISLVSSLVDMYSKMQKHTWCMEIVQQDAHTQMAEGIGTTCSNATGREGIRQHHL